LAAARSLGNLTELSLAGGTVPGSLVSRLLDGEALPRLCRLRLRHGMLDVHNRAVLGARYARRLLFTDEGDELSNSGTASWLGWEKSSYHTPTPWNGSGVRAQMASSASAPSSEQVSAAPTGTATTMRAGFCLRSAATAARMVEPVASPSSTMITIRPRTSG